MELNPEKLALLRIHHQDDYEFARAIEQAVIEADRPRRGEPSGYAYRYSSHDGGTVIRFNNGGEVNGSRPIESVPYWFAPQPAEPVKVPSDAEVVAALTHARLALERYVKEGKLVPAMVLSEIRALLARYTNQENSNGGT